MLGVVVTVMLVVVWLPYMCSSTPIDRLMSSSARYAASSARNTGTAMRIRDAGRAEGLLEAARMLSSEGHIRDKARVDVLDYERHLFDITGDAMRGAGEDENFGRVAWVQKKHTQ